MVLGPLGAQTLSAGEAGGSLPPPWAADLISGRSTVRKELAVVRRYVEKKEVGKKI